MQSELLKNRLIKAIEKLNLENNANQYSIDPDEYNLEEIKETVQKEYQCTFVEKETERKIVIEIKVLM